MRRVLWVAVLLAMASPAAAMVTEIHYVMGTYFRISVDAPDDDAIRAAMRGCFATAGDLDRRFSRFKPSSELSQLNARAPSERVTVSPEMAALLERSLQLRAATHGAFDVTAGALTHVWRSATEWPDADTIATARSGDGALTLSGDVVERRPGVVIDLDGVAKGWAVDRCVAQLRADGIRRAFLSFGESSLYALGAPLGRSGWPMALRGIDSEEAIGSLILRDEAVSVSAVFGHERQVGTRRVGHIVDPRTGLPLTAPGMAAVIAASATAAEALSKALLIDRRTGMAAMDDGTIRGAVLMQPTGIRRIGQVSFTQYPVARRIAAAAEPLR
jgi:thiamine biosynthesis lipoprotein